MELRYIGAPPVLVCSRENKPHTQLVLKVLPVILLVSNIICINNWKKIEDFKPGEDTDKTDLREVFNS